MYDVHVCQEDDSVGYTQSYSKAMLRNHDKQLESDLDGDHLVWIPFCYEMTASLVDSHPAIVSFSRKGNK